MRSFACVVGLYLFACLCGCTTSKPIELMVADGYRPSPGYVSIDGKPYYASHVYDLDEFRTLLGDSLVSRVRITTFEGARVAGNRPVLSDSEEPILMLYGKGGVREIPLGEVARVQLYCRMSQEEKRALAHVGITGCAVVGYDLHRDGDLNAAWVTGLGVGMAVCLASEYWPREEEWKDIKLWVVFDD